jgi:hypothetical protein
MPIHLADYNLRHRRDLPDTEDRFSFSDGISTPIYRTGHSRISVISKSTLKIYSHLN